MSPEVLAYPSLFIAIFFESFILVTILSKPARLARTRAGGRAGAHTLPTVAVIVPCYNEAATVASTADSLLALDYPKEKLEIILVDDGSTDATPLAMERFRGHPQVRIIRKEKNGGKHTALNAGIASTNAEFIGCLDADSFVEPDALREIIPCFADGRVAAVTAAMSVHQPKNIIEHMQNAEYTFSVTLRHTLASVNALYVTPGPFSFYRHTTLKEIGGFEHGYQTEDMEMALRIQQAGYRIENAPHARVYTTAPSSILPLVRQRTRWISGFLRNILGTYRSLLGNYRYGVLGVLILPIALLTVFSSILIFFLMLYALFVSAVTALSVRAGIPLSYAFLPHASFDWFYMPMNFFLVIGAVILFASLALMVAGKYISKSPGNLVPGLISYVLLYGLVAPLWLLRATADVTTRTNRNWH